MGTHRGGWNPKEPFAYLTPSRGISGVLENSKPYINGQVFGQHQARLIKTANVSDGNAVVGRDSKVVLLKQREATPKGEMIGTHRASCSPPDLPGTGPFRFLLVSLSISLGRLWMAWGMLFLGISKCLLAHRQRVD